MMISLDYGNVRKTLHECLRVIAGAKESIEENGYIDDSISDNLYDLERRAIKISHTYNSRKSDIGRSFYNEWKQLYIQIHLAYLADSAKTAIAHFEEAEMRAEDLRYMYRKIYRLGD